MLRKVNQLERSRTRPMACNKQEATDVLEEKGTSWDAFKRLRVKNILQPVELPSGCAVCYKFHCEIP